MSVVGKFQWNNIWKDNHSIDMTKVIIFHGTDCTPEIFWYPYIKSELEKKGYRVEVPSYPSINHESINTFLPKVLADNTFDQDTILIGHSAGCPLILSVLEQIKTPIKQAILVAGYSRIKGSEKRKDSVLQDKYDWKKIAGNVKDMIILNSDNDPWGCDDVEGKYMIDQLGKGKLIVMKGEGHMGSTSYNQPYKEFPFLVDLVI